MFKRLFGSKNSSDSVKQSNVGNQSEKNSKLEEKEKNNELTRTPSLKPPLPITREILDLLFPINHLGEEECLSYVLDDQTLSMGPESVLFQLGESIDSLYYLLEGTVSLHIGADKICEIDAGTTDAHFPLCSGKRYSVSARALTDVQIVRVSPDAMIRSNSADIAPFNPSDPNIPKEVQENQLFQAFCHIYLNKELQIPTLPAIAIKLRHALEAKNVGLREVAEIVQMDPAIAGKLVQVANSLLYRPWVPITNCQVAVSHIGLTATSNLVVGQSLRQIFNCKNPRIHHLLKEEWRKSIFLSSLCWVLASENGGVNPEEAQLAGLVCDIGNVPFLTSLTHVKDEYITAEDIALVLPYIAPKIGMQVLKSWGFPDELVTIPLLAENWFNDTAPQIKLSDIVILSKLHAYIGTPRMSSLPRINSIPAFGKLKDRHLCLDDPLNFSLQMLNSAKEKLRVAASLFHD